MKIARVKSVVVKEFRHIRRDKRTLGVLLVLPAFLMVMYVYALDLDVNNVPTMVYDQDRTPASRAFVERFFQQGNSEYFTYAGAADAPDDVDRAILGDKVKIGLVIPRGFSEIQESGGQAPVQILVDGVMSSNAGVAIGYVEALFQQYTFEIVEARMRPVDPATLQAIDYRPRVWYNPELRSAFFLIPGLIAFIVMITTVVATSLSIVREREMGSMEQLIVSPLRPGELILGKLIPYGLTTLIATAMVIATAYFFFEMPIKGSLWLLFLSTFVYLLGALGTGLLISAMVRSQEIAFTVSTLTTLLPTFILSGFVFSVANMPVVIQAITYIVPAKYFLVILRGIMLKGVGMEAFGDQFLFLAGYAVVMLGLGTVRMRAVLG